jgi:hypothetical protein
MTSPSALAAMYFIVIHRALMNKKKERKDRFGVLSGYLKTDYNTEIDYCKIWHSNQLKIPKKTLRACQ